METGQELKVSSDRLVKPGIEPATPGLQGKLFIHFTTAAPELDKLGLHARKPVFAVWEQQWSRPACAFGRLISDFVIRFVESMISRLALCKISKL